MKEWILNYSSPHITHYNNVHVLFHSLYVTPIYTLKSLYEPCLIRIIPKVSIPWFPANQSRATAQRSGLGRFLRQLGRAQEPHLGHQRENSQNSGPFLVAHYTTALNIEWYQNGTLVLGTTQQRFGLHRTSQTSRSGSTERISQLHVLMFWEIFSSGISLL